MINLSDFQKEALHQAEINKKFLRKLKQGNAGKVDQAFATEHEKTFTEIDCLQCANCCKTTSPLFIPNDIDRIAASLKLKPGAFIDQYLRMDEDGDYVLKSAPCPFLGSDNYCSIYENRPRACREYPHTNRKRMFQIMDVTYQNTLVCPAVLKIVNNLKIQGLV